MTQATTHGVPAPSPPAATPSSSPSSSRTYQRVRLWCGILGIGGILVPLWAGLILGLPQAMDDLLGEVGWIGGGIAALLLTLGATLIQALPDGIARIVEARFGQLRPGAQAGSTASWMAQSLTLGGMRLVTATLSGLAIGGIVALAGDQWLPYAAVLVAALAGLVFILPTPPLRPVDLPVEHHEWLDRTRAEMEHRLKLPWPEPAWYDHGERALAGGWSGVGPWRKLYVSLSLTEVPPRLAAGLLAREIGHLRRQDRLASFLGSVLWLLTGLIGAAMLAPVYGSLGPAGLVSLIASVMTTWCFVGLFIWPAMGRAQVLAADRFVLERGMSQEDTLRMLDTLAERNRPDEELPPMKKYVFHPIPPMQDRRAAIRRAALGVVDESSA
jgi:Zn-dependent protease with chaperone function